jgi:chromate reductase
MSYLVICGTNRSNARTRVVALSIVKILKEIAGEGSVKYYDLQDFPMTSVYDEMYNGKREHIFNQIQDEIFVPSSKWIIIAPEYNGGFPGVLKVLIDTLSVRKAKETFHFKKALLLGVADGRAGNLRGIEQLTGLLNYMKMIVYPVKQPLSQVSKLLNEDQSELVDNDTIQLYHNLIQDFHAF